jgi:hypothetical protein
MKDEKIEAYRMCKIRYNSYKFHFHTNSLLRKIFKFGFIYSTHRYMLVTLSYVQQKADAP